MNILFKERTMQVSLKKAAGLSTALLAAAKAPATTVELSVFNTVPLSESYPGMREDYDRALDSALAMVGAAFKIRSLIGKANEGEINEILTDRAEVDRKLALLGDEPETGLPDFAALDRQREAMAARDSMYGEQTISVRVATYSEQYSGVRALLLKQKIVLNDRLTELNHTTKITLPEDLVELLTEQNLV